MSVHMMRILILLFLPISIASGAESGGPVTGELERKTSISFSRLENFPEKKDKASSRNNISDFVSVLPMSYASSRIKSHHGTVLPEDAPYIKYIQDTAIHALAVVAGLVILESFNGLRRALQEVRYFGYHLLEPLYQRKLHERGYILHSELFGQDRLTYFEPQGIYDVSNNSQEVYRFNGKGIDVQETKSLTVKRHFPLYKPQSYLFNDFERPAADQKTAQFLFYSTAKPSSYRNYDKDEQVSRSNTYLFLLNLETGISEQLTYDGIETAYLIHFSSENPLEVFIRFWDSKAYLRIVKQL